MPSPIIVSLRLLLLLLYVLSVMYDEFIIGTIGVVCCVCSQTANRRVRIAGRDTRSGATRPGTKHPTNTTHRCSTLPLPAVTKVIPIWWTIGTRRTKGCAKARRSAGEAVAAADHRKTAWRRTAQRRTRRRWARTRCTGTTTPWLRVSCRPRLGSTRSSHSRLRRTGATAAPSSRSSRGTT